MKIKLKLTVEQLAIIDAMLDTGIDLIKTDESFAINTNFYGSYRSQDNHTQGEELRVQINEIKDKIDWSIRNKK